MRFKRLEKDTPLFGKIFIFTLVVLFLLIVYITIKSSVFAIKNIDIEKQNVGCVDDLKIRDSSKILGQNFFLINTKSLEADLKVKFFCIKKVLTKREFPNKIILTVLGREAKAMLIPLKDKQATISAVLEGIATPSAKDFSDTYFVDEEGMAFEKASTRISLPKIFLYGEKINLGNQDSLIANTVKILDKIRSFGIDIKSLSILDEFLVTDSLPKIIFKLAEEIDSQIASLQLILEQAKIDQSRLEFIDLRFDKPVLKIAPKKNG